MRTRKISTAFMASIAMSAMVVGMTTPPAMAASSSHASFKVGLVTDVGGLNDHSFNHLAYVGLQDAEKKYGITGKVVQSTDASNYIPNLTAFASQGYQLVIAVGYLMEGAVKTLSKKYPHTKFLIIDDVVPGKNVVSALFNTEQCGFLVGAMAELMNKQKLPQINGKNTVGVIGGVNIPPVASYMAGFIAGVHKIDPKAKVLVNWANSFTDPATGTELANQQISQGADVVFPVAGGTGNGVISAAKQHNVFAIGVDANQNYLAPTTVMTSALKAVDVATETVIAQALTGKFKGGVELFNLKNNGVGFASPIKAVPASVLKKVESFIPLIESGKIKVPAALPKN